MAQFEQVGPVEPTVGVGDPGQGAALVAGQVRGVFQQRSPAAFERLGLLGVPAVSQPVDHGAADRIKDLGGPRHDMEGVMPISV